MTLSATLSRNFPTLRYLVAPFRWVLGDRRRRRTAAAILLAMIAAPVLWWNIQLIGLPDIGDPFDKPAFRSLKIPEESNAYVLYAEAARRLKPLDPKFRWSPHHFYQDVPRPKTVGEARRWIEENGEAMELFRRGTERPDALDLVSPTDPEWWKMIEALEAFHILAESEAVQLRDQGDMERAWRWYRAALRATYHMRLRGTATARMNAQRRHDELRQAVTAWADDRRTTPTMLRQALDDVVACGAFTASETYMLKAEYLQLEQLFEGPRNPGRYAPHMRLRAMLKGSDYLPGQGLLHAIGDAWRFWRHEPERSRRVLRLAFANWIAYEELPADRRPSRDDTALIPFAFHAPGPEAPANARALAPEDLDVWLSTCFDARAVLDWWKMLRSFGFNGYWPRTIGLKERAGHRELVISLARRLYRRDRGTDPPSNEALVGPYLKELPDDGLGDGVARAGSATATTSGAKASTGPE
jgi:hypothetical protein